LFAIRSGNAWQPRERRGIVVEAGVVQPPIQDGSSVAGRGQFQPLSYVAQLGQRVRTVGPQQEYEHEERAGLPSG
jgi:hypothetical protein